MDAVETARCAEVRTLARLHNASVVGGPDGELAALVAVLLRASLQTELILI